MKAGSIVIIFVHLDLNEHRGLVLCIWAEDQRHYFVAVDKVWGYAQTIQLVVMVCDPPLTVLPGTLLPVHFITFYCIVTPAFDLK